MRAGRPLPARPSPPHQRRCMRQPSAAPKERHHDPICWDRQPHGAHAADTTPAHHLVDRVCDAPVVRDRHAARPHRARRGPTDLAGQARDRVVDGERRNPPRRTRSTATPAPAGRAPFSDPQWIQVDLGATAAIDQVVLNWEAAYARAFQIQVSAAATDLDDRLLDHHRSTGGVADARVTGSGRYVRMNGTQRATRLRLLAVGVPGLRQPATRRAADLQHRRRTPR